MVTTKEPKTPRKPKAKKNAGNGPVKVESLVPVIAELERAVIWAYNLTGDRPLSSKNVTVVVQTRGQKKNCLGSFRSQGWETKEGERQVSSIYTKLHIGEGKDARVGAALVYLKATGMLPRG